MPNTVNQDRRVYVGNLPYNVRWTDLKDFMRKAGDVVFADVLTLPSGASKGCGVVEYATREDATNAINSLTGQEFNGRNIFVREVFTTSFSLLTQMASSFPSLSIYYLFFCGNWRKVMVRLMLISETKKLPFNIGWQDLKDLFRQAGNVVRADIRSTPDGQSKGSGVVSFETREDAQNAIQKFNGYDLDGQRIIVREDRFARPPPPVGGGGFGFRGGFRGSFDRPHNPPPPPNEFTDGATGNGSPSNTIHVRNLPWSTSNEDLVELFQTIGKVLRAEIQYEPSGRSKGSGVVEFENQEMADIAIQKFSGYSYGNRCVCVSESSCSLEESTDLRLL
ncbi:hypothetical protein BZA70DRAFT_234431 [Myxozyma melibiosi]|uniref:RRM domain-containing protein n=1 Tax=Myxozyma melibiosi TaxID=54550 RepID=A0ABR1FEJ9_9ASCO